MQEYIMKRLNKLWDEPGVHEQDPDTNDDGLFVAAIDDEGLDDVAQSPWQYTLLQFLKRMRKIPACCNATGKVE